MAELKKYFRYIPAFKTKREWEELNPVPLLGEWLTEIDTGSWKLGDGITNYKDLEYSIKKGQYGPPGPPGPRGVVGPMGAPGLDGATFTPVVTEDGTISWSNNLGLLNPAPVKLTINSADVMNKEELTSKMLAVSHMVDPGADLKMEASNKISRTTLELIDGNPHLVKRIIGHSGYAYKAEVELLQSKGSQVLFWKAQGDFCGKVLAFTNDGSHKFMFEVCGRTRLYSYVFNFSTAVSDRKLFFVALPSSNSKVSIWDFDKKVVSI